VTGTAAAPLTLPSADELRPADYMRLARELDAGAGEGLAPLKVAALASHSLGFVQPFLSVEGARLGLRVATYFGAFGQFEQELMGDTALFGFQPDALVLALRPEDVDPEAVVRFHAAGGERFAALARELPQRTGRLIDAFRARSNAPVLVANFAPADLPLGPFDAHLDASATYAFDALNRALRDAVAARPNAFVWDYAGLVRGAGADGWTDPRLWALGRIAVAARHQPTMARHLARSLAGVLRPPAKCLVLDLDNTLWGGAIGDDGLAGIQLSDDYPGNVFKAFQRSVLALADRGILLAVASKNDLDTVERAFREHPEMLIRWEHLAAVRVNWEPKSRNLRAIAEDLNMGADALVLFDDNPVERAEVRANAPEVGVIEVPAQPAGYVRALRDSAYFDQTTLSDEDRGRAGMYGRERQRRALERRFSSPEEFLAGLEMVAQVGELDGATQARIAQLVGKTNQFNLTTRRHSAAALAELAAAPDAVVAWLRLRDRFGDQGLVAVGILRCDGDRGLVDSFLMSCRVMNRRVEHALMAYLLEHARRLGCDEVVGEFLRTRKNGIVERFYADLGFEPLGADGEGGRYRLDLRAADVAWPDAMRREDAPPAPPAP